MSKGMVVIDEERCKGCGLCVEVCQTHVLQLAQGRFNQKGHRPVEVNGTGACTGCATCAVICPDAVFTVYRRKRETLERSLRSDVWRKNCSKGTLPSPRLQCEQE